MRFVRNAFNLTLAAMLITAAGCSSGERKSTRKISVEGPHKKTELKMETTRKVDD